MIKDEALGTNQAAAFVQVTPETVNRGQRFIGEARVHGLHLAGRP